MNPNEQATEPCETILLSCEQVKQLRLSLHNARALSEPIYPNALQTAVDFCFDAADESLIEASNRFVDGSRARLTILADELDEIGRLLTAAMNMTRPRKPANEGRLMAQWQSIARILTIVAPCGPYGMPQFSVNNNRH